MDYRTRKDFLIAIINRSGKKGLPDKGGVGPDPIPKKACALQ